MHRQIRHFLRLALAASGTAIALCACGGGGGGGGGGGDPSVAAVPAVAAPSSSLAVACTDCGAIDGSTYAGSGTGVWQVSNDTSAAKDFPVAIQGLSGQLVTLVFTNETAQDVAMPSLQIRSSATATAPALAKALRVGDQEPLPSFNAEVARFNREGFAKWLGAPGAGEIEAKLSATSAPPAPAAAYTVGQQRTIHLLDRSQRTVELASQRATGDGTVVNLWVETSELGPSRVTTTLVERLRDAFAAAGGIYDMLVKVGGPLWGPHGHAELLAGSGQPIEIFLVNFDRNGKPYGMGGYFWGLNNFRKGAGQLADSNESLSMYMDTETMYLDGDSGMQQVVTALAHEGMHMQNFYRRSVGMGSQFAFDEWLEEMSALMMEDWASYSLDNSHNAIRDTRLPYYLNYRGSGSYNCELTRWDPMGTECESYAVVGSFGGYLNRQFGLGFFQSVLNSRGLTDSAAMLDAAIKAQRPTSGIGQEMRRFSSAAAGLVPLSAGVAGYSMPTRNDDGLRLVAMDPAAFGEAGRGLPTAVPATLKGFASFPVSRLRLSGIYRETVRVPQGSTLTVVIR